MLWLTRSTARSGGTVTSMTTATVPEAGIAAIGVLPRRGWVAVTNASPSSRSSVSPSGAVTAIAVRVTGAANPLVTSRSYSRWSSPSLPDTRKGSFVAETTIAVVFSPTAGEATGVASCAHPFPGSAAMDPPSRLAAARKRSRRISMVHLVKRKLPSHVSHALRALAGSHAAISVRSFRATGGQVIPGIGMAHTRDHLANGLAHQLGLILVDVVTTLGGHGEACVRHEGDLFLVRRADERFQLRCAEPLGVVGRQGERLAVGQDGQGHRRQRRGRHRLAHHRVVRAEFDRLAIAVARHRDDRIRAEPVIEPH